MNRHAHGNQMNQAEIEQIIKETINGERKSFRVVNRVTLLCGVMLPLLVWVFSAGEIYRDVQTNTGELKKREASADAVPVIQEQIKAIKEDVGDNKRALRELKIQIESNRKELVEEIRALK